MEPNRPYAYNYMGAICEFRGEEEQAVEYYEKSIRISKEEDEFFNEPYQNLAHLCCQQGEYLKAISYLEESWKRGQDPEDLQSQIEIFCLGGLFEEAQQTLQRFRKAADLGRSSFAYKWEEATILRDSGEIDEAYDIFDIEGIEEPMARKEAARILYYQKRYKKALKFFQKALKALAQQEQPTEGAAEAEYYLWAAKTCLRLQDRRGADFYAREGLKRVPEGLEELKAYCAADILKTRGGLFAALGEFEKARACLDLVLRTRKCDHCKYRECIDAYYELGFLAELEQNYEKAFDFYNKGTKLSPVDYDFLSAKKQLRSK
jgi:tetratricopeptide (TPR) repeat protein